VTKNVEHIDELIAKYLAKEARVEEIAFVESWANENEPNKRYLDQFRTIFEKAIVAEEIQTFDTDAAWTKISSSLKKRDSKQINLHPAQNRNLMWRIAASIVVVLGAGLFAYQFIRSQAAQPVVMVAAEAVLTDTLPDGSSIVLNKETELAYTFDTKKGTHTVRLKGEAYFDINDDDKKIFIVDIDGVYIRDIGTSFNVKAYPESNTIEVVVEAGEVMFYTDNDSGVYLREDGKGIYNRATKSFTIAQPEENVLAYKTRLFNFSNTDLATVVKSLNGVYDKKIILGDSLKKCRLTVSFDNESQDEIIVVIAETLGLAVKEFDDRIILEGPGCEEE
jgi:ferric-dicitrate binding protein FerR (iron transport regulator)